MINPRLLTRFDRRWPQGNISPRGTRVVHNGRVYLAKDGEVAKLGWGDLALEQWAVLREIAEDGLVMVAYQSTFGTRSSLHYEMENPDATFDDLVPSLALALDRTSAVLLNFPTTGTNTLGAVTLPGLDRDATRAWLADRLAARSQ